MMPVGEDERHHTPYRSPGRPMIHRGAGLNPFGSGNISCTRPRPRRKEKSALGPLLYSRRKDD
jgi:hypothetical protein